MKDGRKRSLEGGFGDGFDFDDTKFAVGIKFRDLVLQPLSALSQ